MSGLLHRDWMLVCKSKIIYLSALFLLFFLPRGNETSSFVDGFKGIIVPFMLYLFFTYIVAYDYKYEGITFACSMPINRKELVLSRYIFLTIAFVVYSVLYIAINMIVNYNNPLGMEVVWAEMSSFILFFGVFFGFIIPMYYQFGYMKLRWIMFGGMILIGTFSSAANEFDIAINSIQMLIISTIVCVISLGVSIIISGRIVENKDY